MCRATFYVSLNKVCNLMLENKLREDIDDSLLEKLLNVIKDGILENDTSCSLNSEGNFGFIEELLKSTQMLTLAQKVVFSLMDRKVKLSTSVKVFTLRLMSLIFEKESVFSLQKDSALLQEFSKSFNANEHVLLPPSIQDAVLSCIFSIGKHPEGTMWIINENLLNYAFSSFSCTSYYVRKTAVKSFAGALSLWTSEEFSSLPKPQQSILSDTITQIVSKIIAGIEISTELKNSTVNNCCISTLKLALETANIRTLVCTNFHLIEEITSYFRTISKDDLLNESVLDLLLALYSSDSSIESLIKEVIEILVDHQLFISAMSLASSFLSISEAHKPVSSAYLQLFCLPLQVLSGKVSVINKDSAFFITPNASRILINELESKPSCIKFITSSINALSKLTSFMDSQALETVLKSVEIAVKGPPSEQSHPMSYVCLENRNICLALLELFSSLLLDTVYSMLSFESKLMMMEYMQCFLERPSFDCNVLSEVLRLLKFQIALIAEYKIRLPDELKVKLAMLLGRKLLDNKEPVVDNALHLAGQLIITKDSKVWEEAVSKHSIHMIVWEIAIEGSNEGFVKASALKVIIDCCLNRYYWEDIKSTKEVNEVGVMEILCRYFHNPDFFIQRESLSCIHRWFQSNEQFLSGYNPKVFSILFCAVKSLDLELKLTALHMWQWLLDCSSTCDITKFYNVHDYLKTLYNFGFVACVMHAFEDYDDAVKFNAAKILLNFRKKILHLGYTKDSLHLEEPEIVTTTPTIIDDNSFKPISTAERDAGIETVLNITTTEQLTNIYYKTLEESIQNDCQCCDFPSLTHGPVLFSIKSFWACLWKEELSLIFCTNVKTSSVFSEYSLSLLDDIIAAEETEINHCADDGLDCY